VFAAKDDQTVEMRHVELAGVEGYLVAVSKGLEGGERVVVEGQLRLTNGARVTETGLDREGPEAKQKKNAKSASGGWAVE
jgi:multidrug efflux system membrane fusion protein